MEKINLTIPVEIATYDELTADDRRLVDTAREATKRSYAPYSKFRVGAAILLDNGEVVAGANQENVAYPSGTCAERTACYYAHATYPDARFREIAIAAVGPDGQEVANPVAPCGACRQALLEYEQLAGAPVRLVLCGRNKFYILESIAATLPFAFTEF